MPRGVYPRPPKKPERKTVRTLRPDEARPGGEPYRYADRSGYVRLRWKVGTNEYVEIREHRAVVGKDVEHVHHRNHNPGDNRPENLVGLTDLEHAALHGLERRRIKPADVRRAIALYEAGASTVELGRMFGCHPSVVWRTLNAAGYVMRRRGSTNRRVELDEHRAVELHDAGIRWGAIASHLGTTREVIERVMRDHGRPPFPPGRPRK